MKQLIDSITKIHSRLKSSSIFMFVLYTGIALGLIAVFLYSNSDKTNYIYNQF